MKFKEPNVPSIGNALNLNGIIALYGSSKHGIALYHDIIDPEKKTLSAGSMLTQDQLKDVIQRLSADKVKRRTVFPSNILMRDEEILSWFVPSHRRSVFVRNEEICGGHEKNQAIIDMIHPSLIFTVHKSSIYISAYKGTDRPSNDTALHHAPYCNVYQGGSMCLGNVKAPEFSLIDSDAGLKKFMEIWEGAFFNSWFTHVSGGNFIRVNFKNGFYAFWSHLLEVGPTMESFSEDWLVESKITLGQFLSKL